VFVHGSLCDYRYRNSQTEAPPTVFNWLIEVFLGHA
jgi:hypothetical protein